MTEPLIFDVADLTAKTCEMGLTDDMRIFAARRSGSTHTEALAALDAGIEREQIAPATPRACMSIPQPDGSVVWAAFIGVAADGSPLR